MARYPELAAFLKRESVKHGQFTLSSGRTSPYYIDGKLASFHPLGIRLISDAILAEIDGLPITAIGGMDMGATPIVSAVALRSELLGRPLPSFTVRKETKAHGTKKPIEGALTPPARVVIVDDVVTTGASIIKAIDVVEAFGCSVAFAISVVDRDAGAREALAARHIEYRPLVSLNDLGLEPIPATSASDR